MRRNRVFRSLAGVLTGILILASGCVDAGPTGVNLARSEFSASRHPMIGSQAVVLTYGNPSTAGTHAAIIGPGGGTLEFNIGSITFPAGALSRPTRITATVDGISAGATFGPHGTVFPVGREPTLTFSYEGLEIDPDVLEILYISANHEVLEVLSSLSDSSRRSASARISHFSTYILGAGRSVAIN